MCIHIRHRAWRRGVSSSLVLVWSHGVWSYAVCLGPVVLVLVLVWSCVRRVLIVMLGNPPPRISAAQDYPMTFFRFFCQCVFWDMLSLKVPRMTRKSTQNDVNNSTKDDGLDIRNTDTIIICENVPLGCFGKR